MNDEAVKALARRAGIALKWRDYANKERRVSIEAARRVLTAVGLPCGTTDELAYSRRQFETSGLPPLMTATAGAPIDLAIAPDNLPTSAQIVAEDGTTMQAQLRPTATGAQLSAVEQPGYHVLELGADRIALAVAPARCFMIPDTGPDDRLWGLAVQAYGLRGAGDLGIGDTAGVIALAKAAASLKADALALSPMHALFAADPNVYSPYAPSSRLFYNPLYADPRPLFGNDRVQTAAAKASILESGAELGRRPLIDWPKSAAAKLSVFRQLFEDFVSTDLVSGVTALAADFARFRDEAGTLLQDYAAFETLHAARIAGDASAWNWHDWPACWRDPHSEQVKHFAIEHENEVLFHSFLQWIIDRSLAEAQREVKQNGMRIGLIADLAVGMSGAGSQAWTNQRDILGQLEVGAPPDLYNANGQNWGLSNFSPHSLRAGGFAPFIATLRACLRHAGGIRIDHAMGLMRLWVIPRGADAREGAYLAYPMDDLLRLIALESYRHRAIVIGEDLGTVPAGFRDRLSQSGIYGMRVLWFERRRERFTPPTEWSSDAAAMTSTHDLPTIAGWWHGHDIATRQRLGMIPDIPGEQSVRQNERELLWRAFKQAKAASGEMPSPSETARVADAAVNFMAQTRSQLALLPLEDALGLEDQPNLPGTIDETPNWRRRYPGDAHELLDPPEIRRRLAPLTRRGGK
ncbi:MAG: 4-alpha-glucanotransferase [Xanthobacteraceae bacterium]